MNAEIMNTKLPTNRPITMEQLSKSLGDVYCRLLDHHPSTQGEILYFIKEMEEKRKDREVSHLQKSEEYSQGISRHLEDATDIQLQHYLPTIQQQVDASLSSVEKTLGRETQPRIEQWLQEKRQARVTEWSKFMDAMCEKSSAVDIEVDEELKRVNNYYKEMEKKLNILDSPDRL